MHSDSSQSIKRATVRHVGKLRQSAESVRDCGSRSLGNKTNDDLPQGVQPRPEVSSWRPQWASWRVWATKPSIHPSILGECRVDMYSTIVAKVGTRSWPKHWIVPVSSVQVHMGEQQLSKQECAVGHIPIVRK